MFVKRLDYYKDGGTAVIETDQGNFYWDKKIGSSTNDHLFDAYPGDDDAKEVVKVSVIKEIVKGIREYSSNMFVQALADEINVRAEGRKKERGTVRVAIVKDLENEDDSCIPISRHNCKSDGGFSMLDLPESIPRTQRSPLTLELSWLHNKLSELNAERKISNVLEFSGGISTWTTYDAVKPSRYVCVEEKEYEDIFDPVLKIYGKINVVHSWFDIPSEFKYDLVFIDGSSCMPDSLKKSYGVKDGVCRKEALMYSERFMEVGSLLVFHDWGNVNNRGGNWSNGWGRLKEYALSSDEYEFVEAFRMRKKGFGIFRKVK
jgi:hypothetical protein